MFSTAYRRFVTAVDRGSLPGGLQKQFWRIWYQALALSWRSGAWTFMNYGWLPNDDVEPFSLEQEDEADRCFIGLYYLLATQLDLRGKHVLEVGSGRGGGVSYISRYHAPSEVIGIDYSAAAVRLATRLHAGMPSLQFRQGDAEKLPFPDSSFDAVINVESSHCYANMSVFVNEVERVLRPGGRFGWVDVRGRGMLSATNEAFGQSGLRLLASADITENVTRALDAMHARKIALIASFPIFRTLARQFSATRGSMLYDALKEGRACYLSKVFHKPGA
jgi:ubiquinone/menaquinone biosynthesis C-methylase UbiE